jgi:hypothetical protein
MDGSWMRRDEQMDLWAVSRAIAQQETRGALQQQPQAEDNKLEWCVDVMCVVILFLLVSCLVEYISLQIYLYLLDCWFVCLDSVCLLLVVFCSVCFIYLHLINK